MIEEKLINGNHCRIYIPKGIIQEFVIAIHGFAGDKDSSVICKLGNELLNSNVATISFDLPCHGEAVSEKYLSLDECRLAIEQIIDYVKSNYDNVKISFFATSFGAYLLLDYLSRHPQKFEHIILRSPAIYMPNILEDKILLEHGYGVEDLEGGVNLGYGTPLFINHEFLKSLHSTSLHENFADNSNYFYVLQGLKDDVINPNEVIEFLEKYLSGRYTLYTFEHADHRYKNPGELEKIIEIVKQIIV